jgi:hypothetical protein
MKTLAALLALSMFVASCGSDSGDDETVDTTNPSGQEDGVVIEISNEGGFMPVEFSLLQTPSFTVFSDGSVVAPTGDQFGFPGPAFTPLGRFELEDQEFADLLAFIDDLEIAAVDNLDINDAPNVADASTTVLRYWDDAGEHRISIYALGIDSPDARGAIIESMVGLLDRATRASEPQTYEPERVVVFTQVAENFDRAAVTSGGEWPLTVTPDEMAANVASYACATISGGDATAAADALTGSNSMTLWDLDGAEYQILARPLLPQQDGC